MRDYDLDLATPLDIERIRVRYHHNDDGDATMQAWFYACTIDEIPNTCQITCKHNNDASIECENNIPASFELTNFLTPSAVANANDGNFDTFTGPTPITSPGTTTGAATWNFGRLRKVSHVKVMVNNERAVAVPAPLQDGMANGNISIRLGDGCNSKSLRSCFFS